MLPWWSNVFGLVWSFWYILGDHDALVFGGFCLWSATLGVGSLVDAFGGLGGFFYGCFGD